MPPSPQSQPVPNNAPWGLPLQLIGLLIAGALVGLGLILWIAANWQEFGKVGRFALVAAVIVSAAALGIISSRIRVPAALLGVFAIGGLFALFGQTYQSSANAYELFAIWAAVALPWVIVVRHDAVWALWVVVAFTALPLWIGSQGPFFAPNAWIVLPAWAIAIAISMLLSPWSRLQQWIGTTHWAFRLAVVLALGLIVSHALPAIISRGDSILGWIGFAAVAAAVAGFVHLLPLNLMLLSAATFGLDVLLICALAKPLMQGSMSQSGLFLSGLISAVVMAGSAVAILKLTASRRDTAATATAEAGPMSTWPVAVLSGLGALLTSLPVIAFLAATFGNDLFRGAATYIAGVVALASAIALMRGAAAISFRQQLAFIGLVIGMLLLSFAVFRDMPAAFAATMMLAVSAGLALVVPARWIAGLLGAISAGFFVVAASKLLGNFTHPANGYALAYLTAAVAGAIGLGATSDFAAGALSRSFAERAHSYVAGWCGGMLIALMAGNPSFLLSQNFGQVGRLINQLVSIDLSPNLVNISAVVVTGLGIAYLVRRAAAWPGLPAYAICGVIAVLSYVRSPIAGAFAIFAVATATGHRALTYLSGFAIIWLIGSFYYWLGWPLIAKAYLLGCLGIALGGIIFASSGGKRPTMALNIDGGATARPTLTITLTLVTVLATAATVGSGIWQNEDIIKNGRRVFVALAPVDPRSLMRGDYMALNFKTPRLPRPSKSQQRFEMPVWAIANINNNSVATIDSFAYKGAQNIVGDIVLRIHVQRRRVVIGTNAFFFQEGQRDKYSKARFGEFRVGRNGKPILIGLADENRLRIE